MGKIFETTPEGRTLARAGELQANAIAAPGKLFNDMMDRERADKLQAQQDQLFQMKLDEAKRAEKEREATNKALGAISSPEQYLQRSLTPEERAGLEVSYKNLTPQEASATRQAVQNEYVNRAMLDANVDATKVANLRNQMLEQQDKEFNRKLKTPGTEEYKAAQKAELDAYRDKLRVQHSYDKPTEYAPQYFVDPTTGAGRWIKPGDDVGSYIPRADYITLAKEQNDEKATKLKNEADASTKIQTLIGTAGNPDAARKLYGKAKEAGLSNKQYLDILYGAGGADMKDKGVLDFGGKELDLSYGESLIDTILANKSKVNTTETSKTVDSIKSTPTAISTVDRQNIISAIKDLRNPTFGAGKLDSYIKDEIDKKYGKGTFDRYQILAK